MSPATAAATRPGRTRRAPVAAVVAAVAVLAMTACADTTPPTPLARADSRPVTTGSPASRPTSGVGLLEAVDGNLSVAVTGVGAWPPGGTATSAPPAFPAAGRPGGTTLIVGDSVLVLIADELADRLTGDLVIDGTDCRRIDRAFVGPCGRVPAGVTVEDGVSTIADRMAALAARGSVPDIGVVVLANNSSLSRTDLDAAMAAFDGVARVVWVNTRIDGFGRQDPNNRALDALAERNPSAIVVDWARASAGRPWRSDHVHPNDVGQAALADLIAAAVACGCPT